MNETLVFLVSGVIAALISAMVCLLFRLWDSQAGQMQCRTTSYCRHPRPGRFPWKMKHGLAPDRTDKNRDNQLQQKDNGWQNASRCLTLIYCMFESVFVILFCEHKDCQ